jgi:hypothetical protein
MNPDIDPAFAGFIGEILNTKDTYLGDGLYASHDGYQFWLTAPQITGNQKVALSAFFRFIERTQGVTITVTR